MKKVVIGIVVTLGLLLIVGGITGAGILSSRNQAVSLEQRVKAKYTANKSNYDSMWKQMVETTQVTELQAQQFKDVYTGLITGRYQDQNVLFKMVKEDNPKLDTKIYTDLARNISDNRKTFDNNQTALTDMIREYNTYIQHHFIMAMVTGRTELDANDYITTSEQTTQAFDTKKADAIQISGKK
jgi:hypothetical protein